MIPIRNIYYMLSYAFQILQEQGYKCLSTEEFHNTADLCAAILIKGISSQIKRGLLHGYIPHSESVSTLHGKVDISESIKTQSFLKKQLICTYDDYSANIYLNQIIKSTVLLLIRSNIDKSRKKELRKLMLYFAEVDVIELKHVDWNFRYDRNNQTYRMLMSICYLVVKGLLQNQNDGSVKMMDFLDEQRMCRLYEKFILEYYKKEHPELTASAAQIPWQVDDGFTEMLPVMQTDIMLTYREKVLIIDAKYYAHTTQEQYGVHTLHSNNLYQIFTYVKNKEYELRNVEHKVDGLLLYARTDETVYPEHEYGMSGNMIAARLLDLNQDFAGIRKSLEGIVDRWMNQTM